MLFHHSLSMMMLPMIVSCIPWRVVPMNNSAKFDGLELAVFVKSQVVLCTNAVGEMMSLSPLLLLMSLLLISESRLLWVKSDLQDT